MNRLKRAFCKHQYAQIENNFALIGWHRCKICGEEKYVGDNLEDTQFKLN